MNTSFKNVLEQASKGDILAKEVASMVMEASSQGLETEILSSPTGNSYTIKYIKEWQTDLD